ncbi:hypothetical protein P1J78_03860 [Psychromarinibacter sp. C21-152]|uniref:Cytochrome c domain-containing protein n=1 Tax=Psychromarinibacter sediminicola TaxID=3033385 RepID=A0AAE3NPW6_9RHOB|nr:hypothetical protein [Psychromarinibacter sediminicola]MDF0599862.1 hypothetical protein [Psychromarinibacter sediminicola]
MSTRLPLFELSLAACLTALPLSAAAQDWWTLSDADFAAEYEAMAFADDIPGQSEVAWMLFARVNQPVPYADKTASTWELWPSNDDTFDPNAPAFRTEDKVRAIPDLDVTKAEQAADPFDTFPEKAGEERTRNMLSYDYIRDNGLITKDGIAAYLSAGNSVDVPIGSVEIKADWGAGATDGAYQWTDGSSGQTFSLLGLHIMAKMAPTPEDPFTSEEPSWFWTTFEFQGNEGLDNAIGFVTYPDALSAAEIDALLQQAGLGGSVWGNYRSVGTQIRFSDADNPHIVLGNTKMEDFAGLPLQPGKLSPLPASDWTGWNSSCHSCHATAAFQPEDKEFFGFQAQIGTGKLVPHMLDGYASMDFIWSIPFNAK